jgi:regulator of sigma E protease
MISMLLNTPIFLISFLIVLGALVFFHELGHYGVAKIFKTDIERFSIGFGKPLVEWTRKSGEIWSIGRIPLGGYVKFRGDAGGASNPDHEELAKLKTDLEVQGQAATNCFHFKPLYQRVLIVLAGPMANFLLAVIITAGLALAYGTISYKSVITAVTPNSPAASAGIEAGDHIVEMNGQDVSQYHQLVGYVAVRSGVPIETVIDRNGEIVTTTVTPARKERKDFIGGRNSVGTIGVQLSNSSVERVDHNLISAVGVGASDLVLTVKTTGTYIGRIFTGKEDGKALGGVARIATMTGKTAVDIAQQDVSLKERTRNMIYALLSLGAALSIGLGVANLMPIPALDGGHLLYYGYEALAGRPLSEQKQEFGFRIGFAVLLGLFIVLTFNDVGYIRSLFT